MIHKLPQSILFCCDHNAVRSPMAEGLMKQFYGAGTYVQSAGVFSDLDIDGFAISVCKEIGIELSRHQSRSFGEMQELGEELSSFDLIIALSPFAYKKASDLTRFASLTVEHWEIMDATVLMDDRDKKMGLYRDVRDQIAQRIQDKFGPVSK